MPGNPHPLTSGFVPTYRQALLHQLGQEAHSILSLDIQTLELTTWYWCVALTAATPLLMLSLGRPMEKNAWSQGHCAAIARIASFLVLAAYAHFCKG
jgi:hypothetical protein